MICSMNIAIKQVIRSRCAVKLTNKRIRNNVPVRCLHITGEKNTDTNHHRELMQVSEMAIKNKLKELSVPFTEGHTCYHIKDCKLCSKAEKAEEEGVDVHINKKTGLFLCHQCKVSGNWSTLQELMTKPENIILGEDDLLRIGCNRYDKQMLNWNLITKNTTLLWKFDNDTYTDVLHKFNLSHCEKSIMKDLKVRIDNDYSKLYFPLSNVHSTGGYKVLDLDGKSITSPKSECPGFLLRKHRNKTVVVVAEILDFLALASQNVPYEILCLPYGSRNLPQTVLPFLENYDKIIFWLGGIELLDTTGNFANKLNSKRCYVIRPNENQASPSVALSNGENLTELIKSAKPTWHPFVTTFSTFREEVLGHIQNKDKMCGVPWKRFPELTNILKGHRRGELTVLTGPTGCGKTTFISEYSLDLAMQGVTTLWGSFEIKNTRLAKMMLQQYAMVPLEENLPAFHTWADRFESLPIYFMTFHGQQKLSTVMDAVEHSWYTYDIAHVIIDNVQFMIEVSKDYNNMDRFWKQDSLIQEFRSFASKNNCHVTLVMHPKKVVEGMDLGISSVFGGGKAVQEADNVLIVQNKGANQYSTRKYLQVSKNRFSGDLGVIPLNFDKSTLSFSRRYEPRETAQPPPVETHQDPYILIPENSENLIEEPEGDKHEEKEEKKETQRLTNVDKYSNEETSIHL